MANSVDPDQTAPIGAVCSGSTLFASILNSSVMFGNYLQQTTSADDIFRCIFFLGALRVKSILTNNGEIHVVVFKPDDTSVCSLIRRRQLNHCQVISTKQGIFGCRPKNVAVERQSVVCGRTILFLQDKVP